MDFFVAEAVSFILCWLFINILSHGPYIIIINFGFLRGLIFEGFYAGKLAFWKLIVCGSFGFLA